MLYIYTMEYYPGSILCLAKECSFQLSMCQETFNSSKSLLYLLIVINMRNLLRKLSTVYLRDFPVKQSDSDIF